MIQSNFGSALSKTIFGKQCSDTSNIFLPTTKIYITQGKMICISICLTLLSNGFKEHNGFFSTVHVIFRVFYAFNAHQLMQKINSYIMYAYLHHVSDR